MTTKNKLATLVTLLSLPLCSCGGSKPASTPTPIPTKAATAAPTLAPTPTPTEDPSKAEAKGLIRKGMDKVLLGQAAESLEVLRKAYELDPENGESDYWLMKAYDLTEESHTPQAPGYEHAKRVLTKMQGSSHAQEAQDYIAAAEFGASAPGNQASPTAEKTPSPGKSPKPGGKPSPKPSPKATRSAPPGDVVGFEKVQFGQTQDELSRQLGASFRPYQGPKLSDLESFSIGRRNIGRYPYQVALGFDAQTTALEEVTLVRLWTTPATYVEYQALVDWAIQNYGPPHDAEDRTSPPLRSVSWDFPSAGIVVKMEREITMSIKVKS